MPSVITSYLKQAGPRERLTPARRTLLAIGVLLSGSGLLAVSLVIADVERKASLDATSGHRTWGSVMDETKSVFEGCVEQVLKVREAPKMDALAPTGRMTTQLHPDYCYQTIQFDRLINRDGADRIEVFDVRVEREFDAKLGTASPFVVIPILRVEDGHLMYQEILTYLKDKRWPYVVVQPNSEEGMRRAEAYAKSHSPR